MQIVDEGVAAKKRPDKNRIPLIKMAQATRTFWSQDEALKFMTRRQKQEKIMPTVIQNRLIDEINRYRLD